MTHLAAPLFLLALLAAPPAAAEPAPRCPEPQAGDKLPLEREQLIAHMGRWPDACLKQMFRSCDASAGRGLLEVDSAATCSLGYEALVRGSFAGDFQAFMAWWRADRRAE
ncbi:hypothetical protein JI739_11785 [Ramlibacter sp. AW1]|uniref:Uncharacterized protein n=1 Tax=Ramlibacter aurantiacus TaxID=2801330 RepID=A0A936ZGI1_9BURK|nr:hypothetical protein [Ramlibacter aurantiacus]MBL0421029.1 hypothetical protein [Ramlibacter aurantiacus]